MAIIQSIKQKLDFQGNSIDIQHVLSFQYWVGMKIGLDAKNVDIEGMTAYPINTTPVIPREGEVVVLGETSYKVDSISHFTVQDENTPSITHIIMLVLEKI